MRMQELGLEVPPCPFCGHEWEQQYATTDVVGSRWMAFAACAGCGCAMWSDADCSTELAALVSLSEKLRARVRIDTDESNRANDGAWKDRHEYGERERHRE